ncbi:trypsin-like serine protease [Amycolatopsis sp. NPDC059657]|uniref:trypsin-like serine protease n=1 Tax=Amycolatopsis sp. NPDC059657 TaxID=3346899 RepID=UPI00366C3B34
MRQTRTGRFLATLATFAAGAALAAAPADAIAGGGPSLGNAYSFVAKLTVGNRTCSGVLIDAQWVLSANNCFTENAGQGGAPKVATQAALGSQTRPVVDLVTRPDRDVVLAKLASPVTGIDPVRVGGTAPSQGEKLRVAGFGRTDTDNAPEKPYSGVLSVTSVAATTIDVAGDAAICKGDWGGPAFRETDTGVEVVALHSTSLQHGCAGETETRDGAVESRVDNLDGWLERQITALTAVPAAQHAINLSWRPLWYSSFKVYGSTSPEVPIGPSTLLGTVSTPSFTHATLPAKQTWYYRVVPGAGAASEPVSATVKGQTGRPDFNGDGRDDIAASYDTGNASNKIFVWNGGSPALGIPVQRWETGAGNWEAYRARWVSGDFNGDGRSDAAAFYNYNDGLTRLWVFYATATGFESPVVKWDSGFGNTAAQNAKWVAGDFDGDGKTDIGGFYDLGNAQTKLYVWTATATGFAAPAERFDSKPGNWESYRATWISGDFNGDGRTDLAANYNYGGGVVRIFVAYSTESGTVNPVEKWYSGPNNYAAENARWVAGDYNGDGRADIAGLYDLGNANTKMFTWYGTATGFLDPAATWETGNGNWELGRSRWVSGDYNGDGRTDLGAFYNYGNGWVRIFVSYATPTGVNLPTDQWDSGPNNYQAESAQLIS